MYTNPLTLTHTLTLLFVVDVCPDRLACSADVPGEPPPPHRNNNNNSVIVVNEQIVMALEGVCHERVCYS